MALTRRMRGKRIRVCWLSSGRPYVSRSATGRGGQLPVYERQSIERGTHCTPENMAKEAGRPETGRFETRLDDGHPNNYIVMNLMSSTAQTATCVIDTLRNESWGLDAPFATLRTPRPAARRASQLGGPVERAAP